MKKNQLRHGLLILGLSALTFCYLQAPTQKISMAVVALVMALWWIFEVLPLGITALLPLPTYPLFGITSTKAIAPTYMSSTLLVFIGGFFVAWLNSAKMP